MRCIWLIQSDSNDSSFKLQWRHCLCVVGPSSGSGGSPGRRPQPAGHERRHELVQRQSPPTSHAHHRVPATLLPATLQRATAARRVQPPPHEPWPLRASGSLQHATPPAADQLRKTSLVRQRSAKLVQSWIIRTLWRATRLWRQRQSTGRSHGTQGTAWTAQWRVTGHWSTAGLDGTGGAQPSRE